jgi:hypothetical protein
MENMARNAGLPEGHSAERAKARFRPPTSGGGVAPKEPNLHDFGQVGLKGTIP